MLKDTALIKFLRYDVEDQLFQYIGGLEEDGGDGGDDDDEETEAPGGRGEPVTKKQSSRDRHIKDQNKRMHCMESALFFDINGMELSSAYAKVCMRVCT